MACYCGREFSESELALIASLSTDPAHPTRAAIARATCERLGWVDALGRPKLMSARVALARMAADGLIVLPPPRHANNANGTWPLRLPPEESMLAPAPVVAALAELPALRLEPVITKAASASWNEAIARYHYLGYVPLSGAQRRYFVKAGAEVLALIGMGAAAWACKPRDDYIGWSPGARRAQLGLVVGNARFLVLPWVRVPNLASAALGLLARGIAEDWRAAYGFSPVLLETFVETPRFAGTSYRAANWIRVGATKGRGKLDRTHQNALAVKDVYCYPLTPAFRQRLRADRLPAGTGPRAGKAIVPGDPRHRVPNRTGAQG
ncbi:MAG TPA: Druantia anti-phage system protein DruA [Streptosporangiaceae bacterium]|nr:Druantia anti-phage system protein DruA [Streptosporangiaceae bacterium]